MAPTPTKGYQKDEVTEDVWKLLTGFDTAFTKMLHQLQDAWDNVDVSKVGEARKTMKELTEFAIPLMKIEIPAHRNGSTYGPCFRLTPK